MGFIGCIPRFIKNHAGWILTALGTAGFAGSVILVGKETPRAQEAIVNATVEKSRQANPDSTEVVELTTWEKVKAAAPAYIPAMITGALGLGCFWGSQIFNAKQQAMILTAYGAMAMEYDQYRGEIKKEYGEEADKRALTAAKAEVKRLKEENRILAKQNGPLLYGIETLPGIIFEAKPIDIQESFMHWNRDLILGGENTLEELYRFIGIPETVYDAGEAEQYGHNAYEDEVDWGMSYVDFGLQGVVNKDGQIIHMITFSVPPYMLGEYCAPGGPGDTTSNDRIYPGYQPERARKLAENFSMSDGINRLTQIFHQPIYAMNGYLPGDSTTTVTPDRFPDECVVQF